MKPKTSSLVVAGLLFPLSAEALFPLLDHIDISPSYQGETGQWNWALVTDFEDADPRLAFMPARDATYPDGEREIRPADGLWAFTGVAAEKPLWIYPEGHGGTAYPGFGDTSAGLADPLRFHLAAVEGPAGGHFSLFRTIGNSPVVFMATADGIDGSDVFAKPPGHHHLNWAFSRKGMWAISLRVTGQRLPGNLPTVAGPSDTARLFFAIGQRARWRAEKFDAATVMDESIAGDLADPDRDGWSNLLEYAFGSEPGVHGMRHGSTGKPAAPTPEILISDNQRYLGISFFRHRDPTTAELTCEVQWQSGLEPAGWLTGGDVHSTEIIDATWERVVVRDPVASNGGRRFARVKVSSRPDPD